MKEDACTAHPLEEAAAECTECGRQLCHQCIDRLARVSICRFCGELALPLRMTVASPAVVVEPEDDLVELDATITAGHDRFVVPTLAAIVIFALSVYVLEARTLLLPANPRFFFMGFWFVVAVIAIARFGLGDRFGISTRWYSLALAFATGWSMAFAPWWKDGQSEWWAPLLNSGALVLVWWFGTGLVQSLDEDVENHRAGAPGRRVGSAILVGLAIFAFLEPLVIASPRASVDRALGAMIVFLAATGVLLAVAAGRRLTGKMIATRAAAAPLIGPLRALLASVMLMTVLAMTLALPFEVSSSAGQETTRFAERGERVAPALTGFGTVLYWVLGVGLLLFLIALVFKQVVRLLRGRRSRSEGSVVLAGSQAQSAVTFELDPADIERLDPREAVVVTYHAIAKTLAGLGYERQSRQTPFEYFRNLPKELSAFAPHLDLATAALAAAAYSADEITLRHRHQALRAFAKIRSLAADLK